MKQGDLFVDGMPVLPYRGSSGHSGTDTSKARADSQDKSGQTALIQRKIVALVERNTWRGLTWKELADELNLHHGTVSGALSVLHKDGYISRLRETRNRCKVYVGNSWIDGRQTELQGRKKCCPHCGGQL